MSSQDFKRSDRIADLIKVEISKILSSDVKDPRVIGVTILDVSISPDMKKADIYVNGSNSFSNFQIDEIESGLEKSKGFIRRKLSQNINLRRTPEIFFKIKNLL